MKTFTNEPLIVIFDWLESQLCADSSSGKVITFQVPHPDLGVGSYAGETAQGAKHRSLKNWLDLAEKLDCHFLTPIESNDREVVLRFKPMAKTNNWHDNTPSKDKEKYGTDTEYARVNKLEEASFLFDYREALKWLKIPAGAKMLALGVNRGDELAALQSIVGDVIFDGLQFTGVDVSASAIAVAGKRFSGDWHRFYCHDLNQIDELDLGKFDCILSIDTLQSPGIDGQALLRTLMQKHCTTNGRILFGFPNCRHLDGEIKYGAKVKNYATPELSLLFKDVGFYKRYLQQHRFRVKISGKYTVFVAAMRG